MDIRVQNTHKQFAALEKSLLQSLHKADYSGDAQVDPMLDRNLRVVPQWQPLGNKAH